MNAKWLFKLSGMYQAPAGINVSAFYNARQGYPRSVSVQTPSRANGARRSIVLLDTVGDSRLPNYQNVDFHVERPIRLSSVAVRAVARLFNLANVNTIQAIRGRRTRRTRTRFRRFWRRA